MTWVIVCDGLIENLIVADEVFARSISAKTCYKGAVIGERYAPPHIPTEFELAQQDITDLQLADIAQGQAVTDLELLLLGGGANA